VELATVKNFINSENVSPTSQYRLDSDIQFHCVGDCFILSIGLHSPECHSYGFSYVDLCIITVS